MSRPALLIAAAAISLVIAACGGGGGDSGPTPVPRTPRDVAERWLELWKDRRYGDMYDLVSPDVQATITRDAFIDRYTAITDEARLTGIDYELRTGSAQSVEQQFQVTFHSSFLGDLPETNTIPLVKDDGSIAIPSGGPSDEAGDSTGSSSATPEPTDGPDGTPEPSGDWRVQWTPSLFFKGITGENLVHFFTRVPRRGSIYDRNSQPLAVDANIFVVGVVPDQVVDKEATIASLSGALGVSDAEVRAAVETTLPSYYFIPVKQLPYGTPEEQIQPFRDLVDLGVVVRDQTQRVYPNGDSLAHVLGYMTEVTEEQLADLAPRGFIAGDLIGAAGMEGQYEETLAGERGGLLATITPEGVLDQTIAEKPSVPGKDIVLTINIGVQKKAEAELGTRVGSIVVMDPRDNSVLALVSYPRFDPNAFIRGLTGAEADALFNDPKQPFLNRAALAQYPPGSTFKPVTLAAGLEKGGYTPDSYLPCPPVWTGLGEEYAQKNWQTIDRGYLTPSEGLMASCDPVFYEMGKTLDEIDDEMFPAFIRQFGYGSATGVGIEEAAGNVPDPKWKEDNIGEAWFTGDAVNMSIGQGFVTATPIQICNVYSALADTAVLRKPLLVARVGQAGAAAFQEFRAETIHPLPISATTLESIRYGLYLVTQSAGGTSYQAWTGTSLDVAGKSGTAEDLSQGSDHVFFAAYADRSDPRIVALGALEEGQSGSAEVAPMLRHVMEAYMAGEFGPTEEAFSGTPSAGAPAQ
jgi:penicillin-binding protein 2